VLILQGFAGSLFLELTVPFGTVDSEKSGIFVVSNHEMVSEMVSESSLAMASFPSFVFALIACL
jgi:hypothetical protein